MKLQVRVLILEMRERSALISLPIDIFSFLMFQALQE